MFIHPTELWSRPDSSFVTQMLAFATDELSMRLNQTLAGLINATLGNAVELIVAILALIKCELQVVQSSRKLLSLLLVSPF
jgi:calcium/proton exchanger cax